MSVSLKTRVYAGESSPLGWLFKKPVRPKNQKHLDVRVKSDPHIHHRLEPDNVEGCWRIMDFGRDPNKVYSSHSGPWALYRVSRFKDEPDFYVEDYVRRRIDTAAYERMMGGICDEDY